MGRYHQQWVSVKGFVLTPFFLGLMDTFGKRLRAARRAMFERVGREPTQAEVGAVVGVKANAASAWEGDISTPPIEAVPPIAAFLGVTPGWLAFGQEPRYADAIAAAQSVYSRWNREQPVELPPTEPLPDLAVDQSKKPKKKNRGS